MSEEQRGFDDEENDFIAIFRGLTSKQKNDAIRAIEISNEKTNWFLKN